MLPVTGPFSKTFVSKPINGLSKTYFTRMSYRQKRPFRLRLPFFYDSSEVAWEVKQAVDYTAGGNPFWHEDATMQKVYNHAYRAFIQKMKADQASWLVTLSERQKTFDMISKRALQLAAGITAARNGNLRALRRAWGKNAGLKPRLRETGSHVLEYSFGWAPLVGDIVSGCQTIANGVPPPTVRGSYRYQERIKETYKPNWYTTHTTYRIIEREVRIVAEVRIVNEFLALLNQLGLTNPAMVAYERTPWSFVLNYFVNLDDWLGSFTDFVGFDVQNAAVTRFSTAATSFGTYYSSLLPNLEYYYSGYGMNQCRVTRATGDLPRPTLSGRLPWRFSVQRAATSVGLLLQRLSK